MGSKAFALMLFGWRAFDLRANVDKVHWVQKRLTEHSIKGMKHKPAEGLVFISCTTFTTSNVYYGSTCASEVVGLSDKGYNCLGEADVVPSVSQRIFGTQRLDSVENNFLLGGCVWVTIASEHWATLRYERMSGLLGIIVYCSTALLDSFCPVYIVTVNMEAT